MPSFFDALLSFVDSSLQSGPWLFHVCIPHPAPSFWKEVWVTLYLVHAHSAWHLTSKLKIKIKLKNKLISLSPLLSPSISSMHVQNHHPKNSTLSHVRGRAVEIHGDEAVCPAYRAKIQSMAQTSGPFHSARCSPSQTSPHLWPPTRGRQLCPLIGGSGDTLAGVTWVLCSLQSPFSYIPSGKF